MAISPNFSVEMGTSPHVPHLRRLDLGASNLNPLHWEFLATPLLAMAGRARRVHDCLAGYAPVSTVQSLRTQQPLYPSSLRPPAAGNESIHKLRQAALVARCAVWEYWHHAMHFFISGHPGMTFVHSQFPGIKNRPGNAFPTCICPADATATHCLLLQ